MVNFAGEDFLLSGGNLTWSDFDHSNLFRAKIKISKACVYKEEEEVQNKNGTAEAMTKNEVFIVLCIHLMGEGESIVRIFPSGSESKFSASWGEGTLPIPLAGKALHNVFKVHTSIILVLYYL